MSDTMFPQEIDSETIFTVWRIDAQTQQLLQDARPLIVTALDGFDARIASQEKGQATVAALLANAAERANVLGALRQHWGNLFGQGPSADCLVRAAQIGRRHFEVGVKPRHYLALCQLLSKIVTDALLQDATIDTPQAVDAVGRVVMMDAEVVLGSYYGSLADLVSYEAHSETRTLKDRLSVLEDMAFLDALTGLFNRRYFDRSIAVEIARASRERTPLSLLICDIDRFKEINDGWGHSAGDRVLNELAGVLSDMGRKTDIVTRFGGEEFCFLLPNTKAEFAKLVAERVRAKVEAVTIKLESGEPLRVTTSIGIGIYKAGDTAAQLVQRADEALYRAKGQGRNCVSE
ncbi:MAG TPA: diguanylate cyclase [Aliidongia sp.]|uniref:diguanylate cyclase domain-containing protein n=1 Tax=Aliidongia sp. TaxID=1914230 RepID=UPI002DDCD46B|nr:diguanylate cyclase [Aliidongia sp.]HEV2674320.1 diguanylate cyclase [Aliidongia sp.]